MELCNSVPLLSDWSWESNRTECPASLHTQRQRNSPNLCVNKCSVSSNALSTTCSDLVVSRLLSPLCFAWVLIFPVCSFFLKKDEVPGKKTKQPKRGNADAWYSLHFLCVQHFPAHILLSKPLPLVPRFTWGLRALYFTKSWDLKLVWVGRDLKDHSNPPPLHPLLPPSIFWRQPRLPFHK